MGVPYVLAIDQGTTSTRAVVYDASGRTCGGASREWTMSDLRDRICRVKWMARGTTLAASTPGTSAAKRRRQILRK